MATIFVFAANVCSVISLTIPASPASLPTHMAPSPGMRMTRGMASHRSRPGHQLNGFPVGCAGIVIPGEQPVFHQHHAYAIRIIVERGGGGQCQGEAGLGIVEYGELTAE